MYEILEYDGDLYLTKEENSLNRTYHIVAQFHGEPDMIRGNAIEIRDCLNKKLLGN